MQHILEQVFSSSHSLQISIFCRVVQFEVRPKVWVRRLSRIQTNMKSAVRSSVRDQRIFRSSSNFTACVCQNCKGQQPPPVQSHSFLAVKVTCSMIYMWNLICNLYQARKFPWSSGQTCHTFWTAKDLYNAALALHLQVLLFLLYNDDMVPFQPPFSPYNNYKDTRLIGKIWRWGEEPKGPRFPRLHIEPFEQLEGSKTFTILPNSCSQKNELNNPDVLCAKRLHTLFVVATVGALFVCVSVCVCACVCMHLSVRGYEYGCTFLE
jgi:hypothetical protein